MPSVTVFCSSSVQLAPDFHDVARAAGTSIAAHRFGLVEHGIEHRFIHERVRDLLRIDPEVDSVLDSIRESTVGAASGGSA